MFRKDLLHKGLAFSAVFLEILELRIQVGHVRLKDEVREKFQEPLQIRGVTLKGNYASS